MSITIDRKTQQTLYAQRMNMGGRIKECLDELGWKQVDLLAKAPELEVATLSALIKRDAKRSEYAPMIADALGVHLKWLTSGEGPKWLKDTPITAPGYIAELGAITQEEINHILMLRKLDNKGRRDIQAALEEKQRIQQLSQELAEIKRRVGNGVA